MLWKPNPGPAFPQEAYFPPGVAHNRHFHRLNARLLGVNTAGIGVAVSVAAEDLSVKKTLLSFVVVAALVASGCTHTETGNTGEDIPEISNSTDQSSAIQTETPVSSTSLPGGAPDFEPSPLSNSSYQSAPKVKLVKRHKKHSKKKHAKKKHGKKQRLANKKSSAELAE